MVEFFLEEIFLYRDFIFKFSWTSGRFILEEIFLGIFDAKFPGPVVEFSLEEIFLGIFDLNFPGPVVELFLGDIFLRILMQIFLDQW